LRLLRSVLGVLLALIGLLVTAVGAALAFWVIGPDDTVHTGEQHLSSKGLAIISDPDLLDRHGPTLHLDARSTAGKPLFVGVARVLDFASYLKQVPHTSVVQVRFPIALDTQEKKGDVVTLAAPNGLDWWVAKANGTGTQSLEWPIADGPYDVVVMNADGKAAPDAQVDFGIELDGAFLLALGVFVVGLLLLVGGFLLILLRRKPKTQNPLPVQTYQPEPATAGTGGPGQSGPGQGGHGTLRRIAGGAVLLALVSGCVAVPEQNTVDKLTRPAISNEGGVAQIKHYNEVNNAANRKRDDKLIGTIEGGSLRRTSTAGYTISRALDKAGKDLNKPFTYTNPVVAAPAYGGYPMQFVSSAGISTSKTNRHLGLWERATAGSPWLMTFAVPPQLKVKVPDITGLRPTTPADQAKLLAAPAAAGTALAQYLSGGAKSPRAASFAPATEITALLTEDAADVTMVAKNPKIYRQATHAYNVSDNPVAFTTKSGEALVFLTLLENYQLLSKANVEFWWSSGDASAFSPATAKYQNGLTRTTVHQVALAIPPKGSGKIRVLGVSTDIVDAGGF
jgi:hypothetical protein